MSKFVKIQTKLQDVELLKRALADTRTEFAEDAFYRHIFSGFAGRLPIVARTGGVSFGFRPGAGGELEVLADDMHLAKIRPLLEQIQQRYALHSVLREAEAAGFALVEQSTGQDQVIRLTVRRWA